MVIADKRKESLADLADYADKKSVSRKDAKSQNSFLADLANDADVKKEEEYFSQRRKGAKRSVSSR